MTRVGLAKKGTKSMKTTIPEGIVEFLELSDKDELEWKMEFENQQRIVLLQKKGMVVSSRHVRASRLGNK
jgi:hypothetical protein